MDKNTQLQDKLRVLLAEVRGCFELKEETDVLSGELYEEFWNELQEIEGTLTSLKSDCMI